MPPYSRRQPEVRRAARDGGGDPPRAAATHRPRAGTAVVRAADSRCSSAGRRSPASPCCWRSRRTTCGGSPRSGWPCSPWPATAGGCGPAPRSASCAGAVYFGIMLNWTGTAGRADAVAAAVRRAGGVPGAARRGRARGCRRCWSAGRRCGRPVDRRRCGSAQEALRDRTPFGGFPWARLAFSQGDSPLLGLAALGGAPLVTFAIGGGRRAAGAAVVAVTGRRPRARRPAAARPPARGRRGAALVGAAAAVVVAGLAVPLREPGGPRGDGRDRAGQRAPARAGVQRPAPRGARQPRRRHAATSPPTWPPAGRRRPDLVVWPENSSDIDPLRNPDAAARISAAADAIGVPILVGARAAATRQRQRPQRRAGLAARHAGRASATSSGTRCRSPSTCRSGRWPALVTDKVDLVRSDFVAGDRPGVLHARPGPDRRRDLLRGRLRRRRARHRDRPARSCSPCRPTTPRSTRRGPPAAGHGAAAGGRARPARADGLHRWRVRVRRRADGRVYGATSFFTRRRRRPRATSRRRPYPCNEARRRAGVPAGRSRALGGAGGRRRADPATPRRRPTKEDM